FLSTERSRARIPVDLGITEQENDPLAIAAAFDRGNFGEAESAREMLSRIPRARSIILAAAFRALGARRGRFEKGETKIQWEPDFKTQLEAAKFLLAYADGLPIQTTLAVAV